MAPTWKAIIGFGGGGSGATASYVRLQFLPLASVVPHQPAPVRGARELPGRVRHADPTDRDGGLEHGVAVDGARWSEDCTRITMARLALRVSP